MTVAVATCALPHFVYRCLDNRTGRLLYVGMTHDVPARFVVHRADQSSRASRLLRRCDYRVEVDPTAYPNREDAEQAERHAIGHEGPLFNVQHTGIPYWLHRRRVTRFLEAYIDGLPEA